MIRFLLRYLYKITLWLLSCAIKITYAVLQHCGEGIDKYRENI